MSEAAMRLVVGDRTVNEVLTVGRTEIANRVHVIVQELSNEYSLGIKVDQVVLQDVNPPDAVKAAFNAVNQAQQERATLINEAESEYNKVVPRARGQAQETIQKAEGYAAERVNNAQGEVSRFNDLYKEYIKAPEVTRRRIYLETMNKVLPKLGNKIITDENGNNVLPLLQMKMQNNTRKQSEEMSKKKILIPGIIVILLLIVVLSSAYIVDEKQQVVITQFGRPIGEAVTTPGINFKVPFIQNDNFFDKRYLEWDGDANQIPTKDKKFIFIDTYARWQITDPLQCYKRLTNERGAKSRINDIIE